MHDFLPSFGYKTWSAGNIISAHKFYTVAPPTVLQHNQQGGATVEG